MEPLWSPVVANGGNRRQIEESRKPQKQAKTVAVGCDPLPETFHGKEGVSGSSPEEGSYESPAKEILLLFLCAALHPACSGMEQVLEQPDERDRDFVVWPGIRVGREALPVGALADIRMQRQLQELRDKEKWWQPQLKGE